jgi:hypothetical protein
LAVVGFCFNPINVQGFLLSNLAGRSLKHPVPQKGLYSRIEYDAREPRLDEFGLPLDPADLMEKPRVPLKVGCPCREIMFESVEGVCARLRVRK